MQFVQEKIEKHQFQQVLWVSIFSEKFHAILTSKLYWAKIANMQTEPCYFSSRTLHPVVSKKKISTRLDGIV